MAEIFRGDLPNAEKLPEVNLPELPDADDDRGLVIRITPPEENDDISASYMATRKDMNAMAHPAWQGSMDAGVDPGETVTGTPMFDRVETRTDGERKYHVGVNEDDASDNIVLMVEDFVGDVAAGIGKGTVSGLQKAGEQIGDTLTAGFWSESIAPWLRENIPYLPEANVALGEALEPEGTVQEVTKTIADPLAQVVAPGSLLSRTFRAAGIGNRYLSEALGYGVADVAAVDPKDTTLLELGIQLIDDSSEIREMLEASLGAQEDENAFIERLKNAPRRFLEGGPVGLVFERAVEGLGVAYRAIKNSPKYKGAIEVFNETARSAQQGTFFSGIPTRPSAGQISEADRVVADDLINRPELWGEDVPNINERREMVDAILRGERFENDEGISQLFKDHAERLRIEQAEPAPVFYSAVANAVDALPMEKGNASQMRAMIAKSPEVKAEEMAWIGLDDFLKGKKSVTKQEIKDFVDANQVRIEEVVKGGREIDADYITKLQEAEARNTVAEYDIEFDADEGGFVTYLYGEPLYDFGGELRLTKTKEEAQEILYDQALESVQQMPEGELLERAGSDIGNTTGPGGLTKFSDYTLPGGENYREVLLRLPPNEPVPITKLPDGYEVAPLEGHPTAKYTLVGPSGVGSPVGGSTLEEATDQAIERLSIDPPKSPEFTGGHYDESNVLAHMRLNDRTGPNGEKILFVEEIQSDWHQKGRKRGYKGQEKGLISELPEGYTVESGVLPPMPSEQSGNQFWRVLDPDGNPVTAQSFNRESAINAAINDINNNIRGTTASPVPDAPLKKTWHEMSFRRIARMAAEEGYDAIAWTPGKLQAERYDLSKQVSELRAQKNDDGTVSFGYIPPEGGNRRMLRTFVPDNEIEGLVGKEMAEKIRGQNQEIVDYSGVDLEVGGEGMKGFYDKMLKGYADKWGKKFGAKVGVTEIITNPKPLSEYEKQPFIDKEQVWTLPVTKKMRDSVLGKGVATFGVAGVAAGLNDREARPDGN